MEEMSRKFYIDINGENMMGEKKVSFQKAWEVLFPGLIYYLIFNTAYIILAFVCQASMESFGGGYRQFMIRYAETVSGMAGGLCSMIAVIPLIPLLKRELLCRREERGLPAAKEKGADDGAAGQTCADRCVRTGGFTVIFAVSASLGLNILLTLTGFAETSAAYQRVADHQYGVAFGIGLVLYGLVSPLVEEVVFRGIIYNRLRRLSGPLIGIVASAVFFGIFHGNLVQGVYGAIMGMFMAYVYERQDSFFWPVLFHAAANLAVYSVAHFQAVQAALFTSQGCVILLAAAAACVFFEEKGKKR